MIPQETVQLILDTARVEAPREQPVGLLPVPQ